MQSIPQDGYLNGLGFRILGGFGFRVCVALHELCVYCGRDLKYGEMGSQAYHPKGTLFITPLSPRKKP